MTSGHSRQPDEGGVCIVRWRSQWSHLPRFESGKLIITQTPCVCEYVSVLPREKAICTRGGFAGGVCWTGTPGEIQPPDQSPRTVVLHHPSVLVRASNVGLKPFTIHFQNFLPPWQTYEPSGSIPISIRSSVYPHPNESQGNLSSDAALEERVTFALQTFGNG